VFIYSNQSTYLLKLGKITHTTEQNEQDNKDNDNTSDYKNFRPVTNFTTVSKILERLASARLNPHIFSSPNYCLLQSAYRSAHSTQTALVKMFNDILGCMDSGSIAVVVSLDISAAFDSLSSNAPWPSQVGIRHP